MKIAWSIAKSEFTIEDHYYFSKLKKYIKEAEMHVEEVENFEDFENFDTIVFNYPEKFFKKEEIKHIERLLKNGKKIIVTGYYRNEDKIADVVNSLTENFGILLNKDEVVDEENNLDGDKYFVVTGKVKFAGKVLMPCSCSVSYDEADVIVKSEKNDVIGVMKKIDKGLLIVLGTCVFWDNYSIDKFDNKVFSLSLLKNKLI